MKRGREKRKPFWFDLRYESEYVPSPLIPEHTAFLEVLMEEAEQSPEYVSPSERAHPSLDPTGGEEK